MLRVCVKCLLVHGAVEVIAKGEDEVLAKDLRGPLAGKLSRIIGSKAIMWVIFSPVVIG